jgi:hypothetical protein
MGIEHGTGGAIEGYRPTGRVFILSWPDTAFFEIMAGELPAVQPPDMQGDRFCSLQSQPAASHFDNDLTRSFSEAAHESHPI